MIEKKNIYILSTDRTLEWSTMGVLTSYFCLQMFCHSNNSALWNEMVYLTIDVNDEKTHLSFLTDEEGKVHFSLNTTSWNSSLVSLKVSISHRKKKISEIRRDGKESGRHLRCEAQASGSWSHLTISVEASLITLWFHLPQETRGFVETVQLNTHQRCSAVLSWSMILIHLLYPSHFSKSEWLH